jgi:glucan phosphoethanolaminetransferase (alkaline phosphatase superfamily)
MLQARVIEKIKTHLMFKNFILEILARFEIMWKNMTPNNSGYRHTLRIYVILFFLANIVYVRAPHSYVLRVLPVMTETIIGVCSGALS